MKIFVPFEINDVGGPSTFARKFKDGMESNGHTVTFRYTSDYDILLLIVQCPLKYLIDAKKRGKKIVQRLDGRKVVVEERIVHVEQDASHRHIMILCLIRNTS